MMYRYSSEFQISPKHVVFLSYLHFNISANALVLNNKIFFLFLVLACSGLAMLVGCQKFELILLSRKKMLDKRLLSLLLWSV